VRDAKMGPVSPWVNPRACNRTPWYLQGVFMTWTTSTYRARIKTPQAMLARFD
jgi:hypothetical protein